ncbi:MAG: hypothetical protein FJZ10_06675 [Candidatus Omnitrophica bacterium]|nr:hypothetical protein [Candidatus Omnitrophota bacterium]
MEQTLIKDRKYNGRYVAIKDFNDNTVIADGKDPQETYEKALKNGYKDPVILFVPFKDMVQIY